jgi:hypothetical protein
MSSSAFRHLDTSLYRLQQSRLLRHREGRLRDLHKTLLKQLRVVFFDAQYAENEFAWPFDTLKHQFIDFSKVDI